ncbi:hypothetical protein B0H13DRAFT_2576672 [Mycena leptocephala]|nr:hypothetical protein B0H13DRAFT_2576672 [Mycena leptocephala]
MSYETLPTAQQAMEEEYLRAAKLAGHNAPVCSNCASAASTDRKLKVCGTVRIQDIHIPVADTEGSVAVVQINALLFNGSTGQCQKIHWKEHKSSCRLGAGAVARNVPLEYRAQKFAEHLMHIPWLMILIDLYAVVALKLDVDLSNATRFCLCARITLKPVPLKVSTSGDSNPIVMLQFERFETKPVTVLTEAMRGVLEKYRKLAGPNAPPPVLLYFSSDGDNFLFSPHPVLAPLIRHAAMRPVFDDGNPITERKVVAELNEFIRLDTDNVCKLRGVRRPFISSKVVANI